MFLSVLAVYFVKRYGAGGLVVVAVCALPMLALSGGRSDADASSQERLEMLHSAMQLFRWYPGRGVGYAQIHGVPTADGAQLLRARRRRARLSRPLHLHRAHLLSFKMLMTIERRYADDRDAAVARTWATALRASMTGMCIGIFFLSFCYHQILWIYWGLVGATYQCTRTHDPKLEVGLDRSDLVRVALIAVALAVVMTVYTAIKVK